MLEGKKVLVTGPTGQVALPLSLTLAEKNDVWGAARFSDPAKRKTVAAKPWYRTPAAIAGFAAGAVALVIVLSDDSDPPTPSPSVQ